jgi:hypothetical protein
MTNATLQEWLEIDKLIKLFCKVSGLQVNDSKTTILYEGLTEVDLTPFKSFLPYTFTDLAIGFKYLGYYLKTGVYRADDWSWLLAKMEKKKIGLWCNRWLSLGGHLYFNKISIGEPTDILDVFGDHSMLCFKQDPKNYV